LGAETSGLSPEEAHDQRTEHAKNFGNGAFTQAGEARKNIGKGRQLTAAQK